MRCKEHDWEFDASDPIGCPVCFGAQQERERLYEIRDDIINCVIDYGLTPEVYRRVSAGLKAIIKGEGENK